MNIEIKSPGSAPNASDDGALETAPVTPSDTAQVADLELELNQMRDRWIRFEVEIVNVRARARRDVDEARQFAVQKIRHRRCGSGGEFAPRRGKPTAPLTS